MKIEIEIKNTKPQSMTDEAIESEIETLKSAYDKLNERHKKLRHEQLNREEHAKAISMNETRDLLK